MGRWLFFLRGGGGLDSKEYLNSRGGGVLVLLELIFCKGGYRNLVYFREGDELSLEGGGVHSC